MSEKSWKENSPFDPSEEKTIFDLEQWIQTLSSQIKSYQLRLDNVTKEKDEIKNKLSVSEAKLTSLQEQQVKEMNRKLKEKDQEREMEIKSSALIISELNKQIQLLESSLQSTQKNYQSLKEQHSLSKETDHTEKLQLEFQRIIQKNIREHQEKIIEIERQKIAELQIKEEEILRHKMALFQMVLAKSELERVRNTRGETDLNFLHW